MNANLERERLRAALRGRPIPIPTLAAQLGVDIAVIELFVTTDAILNAELQARLAAILARSEQRKIPAPVPPPEKRKTMPTTLTARALKCTLVLDPSGLGALPNPVNGVPRVWLKVTIDGGRVCTADVNAKSIRKCKAALAEHGADNVAVIIQGKLGDGNLITDAGIAAQVKVKQEKENDG